MNNQIQSNLYPCAHCQETGTCQNGENGKTCNLCIKKNELKGKEHTGLACGVCGGLGRAEPMTERMNKRMTPILALFIVLPLLLIVFWALVANSSHFGEILAFASALIGTVIGFYFSKKGSE